MENLLIQSITADELRDLIGESVRQELEKHLHGVRNETKELLTVRELCQYLNIKEQTVYNLCSQKKLNYVKRLGKLYFKKDEIDTWLQEGHHRSLQH